MKTLAIVILFSLLQPSFAQDMSGTESYESSHRDNENGIPYYVGGCSLHEDYQGKHFVNGEMLIDIFEPESDATEEQLLAQLSQVGPALLAEIRTHLGETFFYMDDFSMMKLKSLRFPEFELYRFSIGVGGGNGMYLVYRKIKRGNSESFKLVTDTFDGDLNFCDRSVWIK